jgi:hypothetical protein
MRTILLFFAVAALAVASAAESYRLTLFRSSYVGDAELNPGDYKLTVDDSQVVIKKGRKEVTAQVKVETAGEQFQSTKVRYEKDGGKYRLSEIRLGGTNTKLVFN